MKHAALLFLLTAMLLIAGSFCALAQAPAPALGDYGSVQTGRWDSVSTWKLYSTNNAFDSVTTGTPSSGTNVFILTGTTVTYPGGSQNAKSLVVQSGATFQSDGILPSSVKQLKINGPSVWVDGTLGSGPTDALCLETKYSGIIKLAGTGTVSIAQVRPNSSQADTMRFEFAMNANINYAGTAGTGGAGIYTSRGTQTLSVITIDSGTTVTFAPGSNFQLASSSTSLGTMSTILNVNGTLNAPASSVLLANDSTHTAIMNIGSHGVVNVGKNLTPYLPGGGLPSINVAGGGHLNILAGGTADFSNPAATVTGEGTFALHGGATLRIGAPAGLDASAGPIRTSTASLDTTAHFSYEGTGAQLFGKQLPAKVNNLTVSANTFDTLSSTVRVKGLLQVDGILVTTNGGVLSADTGVVNGTFDVIGGGIADFSTPTAALTGPGSFLLRDGWWIKIGALAGLD